jgi:hypothetical protein
MRSDMGPAGTQDGRKHGRPWQQGDALEVIRSAGQAARSPAEVCDDGSARAAAGPEPAASVGRSCILTTK